MIKWVCVWKGRSTIQLCAYVFRNLRCAKTSWIEKKIHICNRTRNWSNRFSSFSLKATNSPRMAWSFGKSGPTLKHWETSFLSWVPVRSKVVSQGCCCSYKLWQKLFSWIYFTIQEFGKQRNRFFSKPRYELQHAALQVFLGQPAGHQPSLWLSFSPWPWP